jgi:hypothetical protein
VTTEARDTVWDEHDRKMAERDQKIEKARGPFDAVRPFMWLHRRNWLRPGSPSEAPVLARVIKAVAAVRQWRYVNNQQMQTDEMEVIAVRVAADQFAADILNAAHDAGQDPTTIAWVVAGLRCPARPFCTGCRSCFTITSPLRPTGEESP